MVGAFAYGWPFSKDCLAGVQPIEYMLRLSTNQVEQSPAVEHSGNGRSNSMSTSPRWSLDQVRLRPWNRSAKPEGSGYRSMLGGGTTTMRPLATPLMTGGPVRWHWRELPGRCSPDSGLVPDVGGQWHGLGRRRSSATPRARISFGGAALNRRHGTDGRRNVHGTDRRPYIRIWTCVQQRRTD